MPGPLRVLVIDDHPDSAETTAQLLTLHGHDARPVRSCAEALGLVGEGFTPTVVLLDLRLPDGDGYALAASLCRLLPARPLLVVVTGLQGQEEKSRTAGFDHCLLKPADPAGLVALLAEYAARSGGG